MNLNRLAKNALCLDEYISINCLDLKSSNTAAYLDELDNLLVYISSMQIIEGNVFLLQSTQVSKIFITF